MTKNKIIKQEYYKSSDIMDWGDKNKITVAQKDNNRQIIWLGIQGIPGLKFYLNESSEAMYVNGLGYFDLDLENTGAYITSVEIDVASAKARANNNGKGYLIIDYILQDI